ncbi:MAG TPA: methyltransferase domain-containing protein [Burkholderiales bacterium]|nr:methyltransferase domain-containing protein [Burkholderiales bacterium]
MMDAATAGVPGKRDVLRRALELRRRGVLFDPHDTAREDVFRGSIDRFCDIALRLRGCRRVLDVGAGHGMLLALLNALGHECHALDIADRAQEYPEIYRSQPIAFKTCNVEVDPIPYPDGYFDAVVCCQVLEHFTHSHLPAMIEMRRVLRPGGIVEVDVPNVASFRNRSRLLRGKNVTYDYEEHYLRAQPVGYKGMSFYPLRHNREFTGRELEILFAAAGFRNIEVRFLKSRRYRTGLERVKSLGTMLKDAVPGLRKSLIAFAEK